jgi:predicted RNase H-like HicB family nuclease
MTLTARPRQRKRRTGRARPVRAVGSYTAAYTRTASGYMGQIVEWPEVISEGRDLDDCRESLRDALQEMALAYRQLRREAPCPHSLIEHMTVEA